MRIVGQRRDQAYLDLLHHGLVRLRNFTRIGRVGVAGIESEHLHELPTLIGEENEKRHLYYLHGTRKLYLEQLRLLGDAEYSEQVSIWCSAPWRVLAQAAGVQLPAWDEVTEPTPNE